MPFVRRILPALVIAACMPVARAAAQQPAAADTLPLVTVEQLAQPPAIVNANEVARAIAHSYGRLGNTVSGRVMVSFIVDETGKPHDVAVAGTSGFSRLDRAALDVARRVRYSPPTVEGRPVRVRVTMPLSFGVPNG